MRHMAVQDEARRNRWFGGQTDRAKVLAAEEIGVKDVLHRREGAARDALHRADCEHLRGRRHERHEQHHRGLQAQRKGEHLGGEEEWRKVRE